MLEFKLQRAIKLSFNGVQKEVSTLTIDHEKMAKTVVALKVANIFGDAMFAMQKKMPATQDNLPETKSESDIKPNALGVVIASSFSEESIKYVINTFCNFGCIYFENENDLKNKTITEEFHIRDLDYIIGYYAVNFTLKRYME